MSLIEQLFLFYLSKEDSPSSMPVILKARRKADKAHKVFMFSNNSLKKVNDVKLLQELTDSENI
jgi:hypothetical protein